MISEILELSPSPVMAVPAQEEAPPEPAGVPVPEPEAMENEEEEWVPVPTVVRMGRPRIQAGYTPLPPKVEYSRPASSRWVWGIGVGIAAIIIWMVIVSGSKVTHTYVAIPGNSAAQQKSNALSAPASTGATDDAETAGYRVRAEAGDAGAAFQLGSHYFNGQGVPKDYAEALKWLKKSADGGNADAQNYIGYMYQIGLEVTKDYSQALTWYQKSADQGDAAAQYNIGCMYQGGLGVDKDFSQALSWYQKAADQGNPDAEESLGYIYAYAWKKQDLRQALFWYQKAAAQGNAEAETNLGEMYEMDGGVVIKDYSQAVSWLRRAADQGNAEAETDLGYLYENGLGVTKSIPTAVDLYKKAAAQSNTTAAQYCLKRLGY